MKQQIQTNQIEWKEINFLDCLEKEASNNKLKIKQSQFLREGKYPIIDQGEEFIAGYTNDKSKIYSEKFPVVVFGDHTRALKFVNFPFALGADGVKILVPKDTINAKYFYLVIINLKLKSLGYSRHYKLLKDKKIPLPFLPNNSPDLKEQERIVSILEKAEKLKERSKNSSDLLDEYLKSVFNEMFYNKGFEEVELGDKKICEIAGEYGSGVGAINYDGKTRYIRITDIGEDGKLRNEVVSPSIIENKYLLKIGDLLFARTGATVGKTYLHTSNEKNYQYAGYLIRFRFNETIISEYVYYFTKTNKYLCWVDSAQKVVAQPNINAKQYSSLKLPFPPLPLQQKFSNIVEHVEKMKENINKTKQNAEELFNSLMQKAFRGEL